MNKVECKKYLRKAYKQVTRHRRSITPKNIEEEMKKAIKTEAKEMIAFAKIAVDNMVHTANEKITIDDLIKGIDAVADIYSKEWAIEKAEKL